MALLKIKDAFSEALEVPVDSDIVTLPSDHGIDMVVSAEGQRFAVQVKSGASADLVGSGIRQVKQHAETQPDDVTVVVVPYMGDVGKRLCQEAGVSWLDLSGNANISARGLKVRIDGNPNRFKERGRPVNMFAPVSSRVARVLLLWPDRWFVQQELAEETGMSRGGLSRLLPRYAEAGFIERQPDERRTLVKVRDPDLLLNAWREAYDFSKHDIKRGHVVARPGETLLGRIAEEFAHQDVEYAATGLAAAWLLEPFAMFRLVTLYLRQWPGDEVLQRLGFREEPRGANVWLVLPRDEGVLYGGGVHEGIRHVSPVQTYLDLKAQPERAEEAAEELRRKRLTWSGNDG